MVNSRRTGPESTGSASTGPANKGPASTDPVTTSPESAGPTAGRAGGGLAEKGKVWFIGAGPGDPELITLKGHRLIAGADLVIYAGSLVPEELVQNVKPGARVVDSAPLHLEEIHALICETVRAGGVVARVHTGDPSLYGALREQMDLLARDGIAYGVVPGVTAAFAAAAAAAVSITLPETVQSFSITRLSGRTPVPEAQSVHQLARHGGSMAVYLSGSEVEKLTGELRKAQLPEHTPILAAYRVGWPEEKLLWTTLACLEELIRQEGLYRQVVFLVLPGERQGGRASKLYDKAFSHGFRGARGETLAAAPAPTSAGSLTGTLPGPFPEPPAKVEPSPTEVD